MRCKQKNTINTNTLSTNVASIRGVVSLIQAKAVGESLLSRNETIF